MADEWFSRFAIQPKAIDPNAPERYRLHGSGQIQPVGARVTETGTVPSAGGDEFASLSPDDQQLARTLRQRYGPGFDVLGDQQAGLPYFKRRMAETAAEGDPRDLGYWLERAGGTVEAEHARQIAARGGGATTLGGLASGALMQPWGQTFTGADGTSILDSPAFKAAQTNATDALQRSAAAKGTLITGGFEKDLSDYQMGLGLGAINDQFNRDLSQADFNRGTFWGDTDRQFNRLSGLTSLGMQGASTLGSYGSGYAGATGDNARTSADLATGMGNANAAASLGRSGVNSSTLANIINAAGSVDWSKIFSGRTL